MKFQFPDRKVLAGGVSGILTFTLTTYAGLDPELSGAVSAAVWGLVSYFVPPSAKEIIKRVDDTIIGLAVNDPDSPATAEGARAAGGS